MPTEAEVDAAPEDAHRAETPALEAFELSDLLALILRLAASPTDDLGFAKGLNLESISRRPRPCLRGGSLRPPNCAKGS